MADAVWTRVGLETLLSDGDLLNPSLSSVDRLFEVLSSLIGGQGNMRAEWKNNSIALADYAYRFAQNGAGDATNQNQNQSILGNTTANAEDIFVWFSQSNVIGQEKTYLSKVMDAGGSSASSAPQRIKVWGKLANTPQTTSIQIENTLGVGDFATGSQMQVATATAAGVALGRLGSWVELSRTKLEVAGDTVDVANLPNKRYYMILIDTPSASSLGTNLRFGAGSVDTATNYASRRSDNGIEATSSSLNRIILQANIGSAQKRFGVFTIANLSANEKLLVGHDMRTIDGDGSAPSRLENIGKWTNIASPLDVIQYLNTNSGSFAIGTEMVVLGWTPNDSSTTEENFWQPLGEQVLSGDADIMEVIISPRKYLWFQFFVINNGAANSFLRFNNDGTTNYSSRFSFNGAADVVNTNDTDIPTTSTQGTVTKFCNGFIMNQQSREKMVILHTIDNLSNGAGTAPSRLEVAGKWVNVVSAIANISINNLGAGSFAANSFLRVWGHD